MQSRLSSSAREPARFVPIADLAKRLGVTTRTLRCYQDQGLIRSHRIAHNIRAYDLETVASVEAIVAFREVGLSITVIREILSLRSDPAAEAAAMRSALIEALTDKQHQICQIQHMLQALPIAPPEILRHALAQASGSPSPDEATAEVRRSALMPQKEMPMIARNDYGGPVTKAAEAMFARAERRTRPRNASQTDRTTKTNPRSPSALRQVIEDLGLSTTIIRRWEEAGVVAFERRGGRVVVDETTRETLAAVVELRRAGFTVKKIAWISRVGPPSVSAMRKALQARLSHP